MSHRVGLDRAAVVEEAAKLVDEGGSNSSRLAAWPSV
jgi:hypothetical protein